MMQPAFEPNVGAPSDCVKSIKRLSWPANPPSLLRSFGGQLHSPAEALAKAGAGHPVETDGCFDKKKNYHGGTEITEKNPLLFSPCFSCLCGAYPGWRRFQSVTWVTRSRGP